MSDESVRDEGFDDFLDAVESGEGFYLECPEGHGSLPPRRVCPHCGQGDLAEVALPESGAVATHTTVHVPAPEFADDAPYVTAVVDFGAVRLTGQIRDIDPEEVGVGTAVAPAVDETETTGERILVFRPR
ncbi:Zn-ribbon domain-containing OB-fold protein [Halorussus salilacus]|uniref:Zn-ribbon domain-containing OB-fold protein n=1 Tax=Halorussus salilacus TaxID=2953750 RepID=UPI00209DA258|nr:Zn-ribbon domain-containing OB-fold protein [Halorussus salilacus]USZ68193.1 Zn-ribbon domain-containing OB-fold protein [Halorussus salilacus]